MKSELSIADRWIGEAHPVWIVAELSANHRQEFNQIEKLIVAAKEAGADAIKIQTYTADTLTIDCDNDCFRIGVGTIWAGKTLYQLYREAYTPWEWHRDIFQIGKSHNIPVFSTPFDHTAVDFLESFNVPCHKIASFEIVDLPLIRHAALTGKPLIISTGMASLEEIADAVDTCLAVGNDNIVLLRCTSAYPARASTMNLRSIPVLHQRFGCLVGLSDHSLELEVPLAAVTLGARVLEKHFTLSRADGGPDSAFSLEPHEFKQMVSTIRNLEQALGTPSFGPTEDERASLAFRRSLFVVENIAAGAEFTTQNIRSIRPSNGLPPKNLPEIVGKRAKCDISRGTPLDWSLIESA